MANNNTETPDALEAARRHERALEVAYSATLDRQNELHRSLGLRPWQPMLHWPDFDASLVPGIDPMSLAAIQRESARLEEQYLDLRDQLEAARAHRERRSRP